MCALSVIGSTMNRQSITPLSQRTGATSKSDPNAGSTAPANPAALRSPITTADKAGAAVLTVVMATFIMGGTIWLVR